MSGLYIHIPFCRTRCAYCNFYSSTGLKFKKAMTKALCDEMELRQNYLPTRSLRTIYFGGGTPSLLAREDWEQLFAQINRLFDLSRCEEITLEANPDDLTDEYLADLHRLPFNRISIGIQSFDEGELRLLRRRHTASEAVHAVSRCRQAGFENISIDLMYGLPAQTPESWLATLQTAIGLDVEHISAYHLTYEPQTPLGKLLRAGKIKPVDEDTGFALFALLREQLTDAGFEHYEISNFARANRRSRHNSSYWQDTPYLGIGASAHSYDGASRQWNVPNTNLYLEGIKRRGGFFEREQLSLKDKYNDCIITALRTKEGIDLERMKTLFGQELTDYCLQNAQPFVADGKLERSGSHLRTTDSGIFISDYVMERLIKI